MWKNKYQFDHTVKEMVLWLSAIIIMVMFMVFQIWLTRLADGWMMKIVLCASVVIEINLITKINELFS